MQQVVTSLRPLDDYEIEATLYFTLNEQDLEYDKDEDNYIATRRIDLKHLAQSHPGFGDGQDHKMPLRRFPGKLQDIRHCRLFYDLCTGKRHLNFSTFITKERLNFPAANHYRVDIITLYNFLTGSSTVMSGKY